ncbi:MAG TPA: nuclear transport factor 2 family protein [Candidatus Dormibacteraeota bacterium]|jgi:ketosteroid isomerase-like protein
MTTTNQTALDVVNAYQEAWTGGDVATAARYVADDVVWHGPGGTLTGREAFMAGLGRFVDSLAPGWRRIAAMADEEGVLVLFEVSTPGGATIRCADHFTVRGGRIQSDTMVFDTRAYFTAVNG